MRRNGLRYFAPLALAMSVGLACSSSTERSNFGNEPAPDGGDPNGFGQKADAGDQEGCASSKTEIARVPVVIEFVVDESGSMDSGSPSLWAAARDSLLAAFEEMNVNPDPAMFIGLMRYSDDVSESIDPAPLTEKNQYKNLVKTINTPTAGGGGTSTDEALSEAFSLLESFKTPANAGLVQDQVKRYVVLLSDGVPTSKEKCEKVVDEKANGTPPDGPIYTFSVGIGKFGNTGYDPVFMGRLAQKGGTAPDPCFLDATDPSQTCHFQVTPGQDSADTKQALLDAFNRIRALSASCEFSFELTNTTDLNNVSVEVIDAEGNRTKVEKDDENGWSFDNPEDPSKVVLNGDACSASNGTVAGRVDVTIGCRNAN